MTGRSLYCERVATKLRERADVRRTVHAFDALAHYAERQQAHRSRMYVLVRRLALLRTRAAFDMWLEDVRERREDKEEERQQERAVGTVHVCLCQILHGSAMTVAAARMQIAVAHQIHERVLLMHQVLTRCDTAQACLHMQQRQASHMFLGWAAVVSERRQHRMLLSR